MRTKLFSATAALALLLGTYPVGVAYADDTAGPVFSNIHFSVPTVDSTQQAQTVYFMGHLEDASGVKQIIATCYEQDAQSISVVEDIDSSGLATFTYELPYQGEPGVTYTSQISDVTSFDFAIQLKLPQGRLPGTLSCDWLQATDTLDNVTSFDNYHNADGTDRTPDTLTITRGDGAFDNSGPAVTGASLSGTTLSLRDAKPIIFNAAIDDPAGIYDMYFRCVNMNSELSGQEIGLQLVSDGSVVHRTVYAGHLSQIVSTTDIALSTLGTKYHWQLHEQLAPNNGLAVGDYSCFFNQLRDFYGQNTNLWLPGVTDFKVVNSAPGSPSAPTSLQINKITATSASLSWSKVTAAQKVTDYSVEISADGSTWLPVTKKVSTAASLSLGSLAKGTHYQVRIAAVNAIGAGDFIFGQFYTLFTVSSAPTNLTASNPARPDPLTELVAVTLSWDTPSDLGGYGSVDDYSIEINGGGYSWATLPEDIGDVYFIPNAGPGNTVLVAGDGLNPGTKYSFRVKAINPTGTSKASASTSITTIAFAPTTPFAHWKSATATSATVAWGTPSARGSKITDYLVEYSSDAGATWQTANRPVSASTSFTIKQLTPKTSYLVRVSAKNAVGISAPSQTVSLTTR